MKLLFISPKEVYASKRLVEEAAKAGLAIEHIAPSETAHASSDAFDGLYTRMVYPYYKEVATLAAYFREQGKVVWEATDTDKLEDYRQLAKANIRVPKTFAMDEIGNLTYPVIVKTKYGFGKKEVFLIPNSRELENVKKEFPAEDLIAQEFIPADFEYKVITVGYKSLSKVLRYKIKKSGFGIEPEIYEILDAKKFPKVISLAETGSKYLQRELSKTDIIQQGDKFFVLEVNQSPGLQSFENLTRLNVAGDFLAYIKAVIGLNGKKML